MNKASELLIYSKLLYLTLILQGCTCDVLFPNSKLNENQMNFACGNSGNDEYERAEGCTITLWASKGNGLVCSNLPGLVVEVNGQKIDNNPNICIGIRGPFRTRGLFLSASASFKREEIDSERPETRIDLKLNDERASITFLDIWENRGWHATNTETYYDRISASPGDVIEFSSAFGKANIGGVRTIGSEVFDHFDRFEDGKVILTIGESAPLGEEYLILVDGYFDLEHSECSDFPFCNIDLLNIRTQFRIQIR